MFFLTEMSQGPFSSTHLDFLLICIILITKFWELALSSPFWCQTTQQSTALNLYEIYTFNSPSVESGEDGWRKMCLFWPSQKLETMLGFLCYGAGLEGTREVLCQMSTKEFGALDHLHQGSVDVQWGISPWSPESSILFFSTFRNWLCTSLLAISPPLCMLNPRCC